MSKDYFDSVASQWDRMRQSFFSQAVRDKALAIADVKPGKIAADIGAGTGFITEGLIEKGLKVIAVDQSEGMLAQMRRKFAWVEGLECRLGESEKLPLDDGTVDYAIANMYLHHIPSPPKGIGEMARILKPGGKLIITDLDEHNFEFLIVEHNDRWLGFKREDIQRWLEEAGLVNISVGCAGESCSTLSEDSKQNAEISIFLASGEKP
jgi:ubiquinone/menaquinone biosynthesis C-methylase UbiE